MVVLGKLGYVVQDDTEMMRVKYADNATQVAACSSVV
jgi:hypothetical protein